MKRAYQNRAVDKGAKAPGDQAIQISLPMAEVLSSLEQGLGELVRKVGRMFIESVLESEVEQIAGAAGKGDKLTAGALSKVLPHRWPTGPDCPAAPTGVRRQRAAIRNLPAVSAGDSGGRNGLE
ncbi:MAG: hypothetical protein JO061_15730 [Acidobacteriaceae bacterium]|nr:hypothetical protein [Acidobacteriaceae bacterium]